MSIAAIGAVFVDIKGYPSSQYIPGGRNAGKVRYVHGGVCRNVAEDLGNMGLKPVFVSLVDPGGAGEDVIARLQEQSKAAEAEKQKKFEDAAEESKAKRKKSKKNKDDTFDN